VNRTEEVHMNAKLMILLPIGLLLALGGCNLFINPDSTGAVNASDIAAFQRTFMSSYFVERGGKAGGTRALTPPFQAVVSHGAERATVPVALLTNTSFLGLSPSTFVNYPEPGQSTSFTITVHDSASSVYDITATTTYSAGDARKKYVEEYYVKDGNPTFGTPPDYVWTIDDPIVSWTGATWVQDQKSRVRQVLTFADGTTRTETIVSQTDFTTHLPKFAAFDVNGSLDFGQFFYPATDTDAAFSSVVVYSVTPATNPSFWFWQGSQSQCILGIRYYTEFNQGGKSYSYTILFEKTLSTLSTQGISTPQIWQTVFVGSQFDTLAESVLRQEAAYDLDGNDNRILSSGVMTTNMQSRVVNITGQKDFFLQQLNTDYVTLSAWDTTTVYTPTGNAAEVLAGDPSKFAYSRTGHTVTGQSLAVTDTSGLGDLADLYVALINSAVPGSVGSTTFPLDVIPAPNQIFNGSAIGSVIDYDPSYNLSPKGTIEAWVYITQHTDTGGIVHKGESATFSDECYSLQFWGNQGQVALVLDRPNGTSYDLLTSTINLNTGRWYYLVATWEADLAGSSYMKLYIDGVLNASRTPTFADVPQINTSEILIGSQLPNSYSMTYGYFSFNGAIAGVRLSATPSTNPTSILAYYNLHKNETAGWSHP
jgi:hypothetical protein